jgi:hypothetical protein
VNRDRLTVLRDYLRSPAVKPEAFNIDFWWRTGRVFECGYAGCAVGHACHIPEFIAAGLVLWTDVPNEYPFPQFGEKYSDDAAMSFFDLTDDEVRRLFYADSYFPGKPSQFAVANRIDELLTTTPNPTPGV